LSLQIRAGRDSLYLTRIPVLALPLLHLILKQLRSQVFNLKCKIIFVTDGCLGGEPLRIIVEGFDGLKGSTILEKRRDASERFDWARKALMREPRGHNGIFFQYYFN
jgi:hypothetical protein